MTSCVSWWYVRHRYVFCTSDCVIFIMNNSPVGSMWYFPSNCLCFFSFNFDRIKSHSIANSIFRFISWLNYRSFKERIRKIKKKNNKMQLKWWNKNDIECPCIFFFPALFVSKNIFEICLTWKPHANQINGHTDIHCARVNTRKSHLNCKCKYFLLQSISVNWIWIAIWIWCHSFAINRIFDTFSISSSLPFAFTINCCVHSCSTHTHTHTKYGKMSGHL